MTEDNRLDDDSIKLINEFKCGNCGEELKLIHIKGKYMAVSSVAAPILFGAGGYSIGGSMGLTALGTGIAASWPVAAVGALLGGTAVYVSGATKDSLRCPECDSDLDVE